MNFYGLGTKLLSGKLRHIAFTLAEVLIVLGIIGIVAQMTIPALVQNVQEQQYKAGAKKSYSALSQALLSVANDNGGDINGLAYDVLSYQIADKMILIDDCGGDLSQGCHTTAEIKAKYRTLGGNFASGTRFFSNKQYITADGIFWGNYTNTYTVDVNGYEKSPNTYGIDVFGFQLVNGRFLPIGAGGTGWTNKATYCNRALTSDTSANGLGCTDYTIMGVDY